MKKMFIFYRVDEWFYFLSFAFWGYIVNIPAIININILRLGGVITVSALYLAHGYALNDLFDSDYRSKVSFSFKKALYLSWLPLLAAIILAVIMNNVLLVYFILAGSVASYLYSGGPFRMKNIPIVELLLNAVCFVVIFLFGTASSGKMHYHTTVIAVQIFILLLIYQLVHEIEDSEEDRRNNIHNTLHYLGFSNTFWVLSLLCFMLIGHAVYFWGRWSLVIAVCAGVFSLFFLKMVRKSVRNGAVFLKKHTRILGAGYGLALFIVSLLWNYEY